MAPRLLPLVTLLFLRLDKQPARAWTEARLNCPDAPSWRYWNESCYCLEADQSGTWAEALRFCKRYRFTELVTLTSIQELNWIFYLPLDNFWIGLNNLERTESFSWSEGTQANMTFPWLQLSHSVDPKTVYCVKVSERKLVALNCNTKAHWICKRSAAVDRYQEHKGKMLLSPLESSSQPPTDLESLKAACLELREKCTGLTVWSQGYVLAKGTVLLKSEDSRATAYVKTDCSFGYVGKNCSSVCSECFDDELCNPYTGNCDSYHSCRAQDSPAVCAKAQNSEWCPRFPGWYYWADYCYYFSQEAKATWADARKQCLTFRGTDLMWLVSKIEKNWIFSINSSETLWIGLNSIKQKFIWVWSNTKSAAKELHWLTLTGNPDGRCVGLNLANKTVVRLNCNDKYKWICKRKEVEELFDVFIDQFLSGPLNPVYYTSLSKAAFDCLRDASCTGIVQDYRFYRRTSGINEIMTYEETATVYKRRECTFGYYGYNCASKCKKCYGGYRCNSITGKCPERMHCIGQFKGELCELGIRHSNCPQNGPWWFYDGHCYYFEKTLREQFAWAAVRCSYYKDGNLAKVDSKKKKDWLGSMLETDSWIGMLHGGTSWKWSGGRGDINSTLYSWLWDFPLAATGCVQMTRGGRLQTLPCTDKLLYVCEKRAAGHDLFIDYPQKIMLSVTPLAVYNDFNEARFHCLKKETCTGINSWPNKHFLVSGVEMVVGLDHHMLWLKTSCSLGRYGLACEEVCPKCRNNALCNMLTGFCDEKGRCRDTTTLQSCSETTMSGRCPDMNKWRYWNRHCYYFISDVGAEKTWEEANTSCSRFRASELLWIEEPDDLKWIEKFFENDIWLGLQDIDYDGTWAWSHEENASRALAWMDLPQGSRLNRCTELSKDGVISKVYCSEKREWVCKRPAEQDFDIYTGFWDLVAVSEIPGSSVNYTYREARDECIKQSFACLGFGLWQDGYFILNGPILVGGGFAPSMTFIKSACDFGFYGPECDSECPHCHWDKPCHPITGQCERPIICAAPHNVGMCSFGLYSLKCPLGDGWWFWEENCYLIEKTRKVTWRDAQKLCKRFKGTRLLQLNVADEKNWLEKMITEQMWIGIKWHSEKAEWRWSDGGTVNTNLPWLKIEGEPRDGCVTILKNDSLLRPANCDEKFHFVCKRQEYLNIFQKYPGFIVPQRENTLPKVYYTFSAAQEDCIFEKTLCTGIVLSGGQYFLVSGMQVFKSLDENNVLYLKSGCNPGFFGTNCQFVCKKCNNNLPCHPITGECLGTSAAKCSFDNPEAECGGKAHINPCPQKPQWYYYSKSCFYVEDKRKDTWANARTACQGYKGTDLVKIANSREKMWIQYKADDSWIGLTLFKRPFQYLWVDRTSSAFQNAWVVRRNRRHTESISDCGVAFKKYLSVTDCSQHKKWICKRMATDLLTELVGRAFYIPFGEAPKYSSLDYAKRACLGLKLCTGVAEIGSMFVVYSGVDIYNSRNKTMKVWIKSDCAAGRFGETCQHICHECDDGTPCNPYTGFCGDSIFCSHDDPNFTCEKGILIGGRCPVGSSWVYWHGSCYYVREKNYTTWGEARDMCRQYRDTDLLWITNEDEKKSLLSILPEGVYWTGLYGNTFCNYLSWTKANVSYTDSSWLRKTSWTFYWDCCIQLHVPSGSMPGTNCYWKKAWVCKKREEESMDFLAFHGYYLAGFHDDSEAVVHNSLTEAFQHCRYQRASCTAVQKIKFRYMTYFAKNLFLVSGAFEDFYTAYLKSACTPGYYGPECDMNCTCNGTDNCNPLNGQCSENEQCSEDYIVKDCKEGVINLKCPRDPGWLYWKNNCYYVKTTQHLKWREAKDFCKAYHETHLIKLPGDEDEELWLISVLKDAIWIDTSEEESQDTTKKCTQMLKNGTLQHLACSSLSAWICKRHVGKRAFIGIVRLKIKGCVGTDLINRLLDCISRFIHICMFCPHCVLSFNNVCITSEEASTRCIQS